MSVKGAGKAKEHGHVEDYDHVESVEVCRIDVGDGDGGMPRDPHLNGTTRVAQTDWASVIRDARPFFDMCV